MFRVGVKRCLQMIFKNHLQLVVLYRIKMFVHCRDREIVSRAHVLRVVRFMSLVKDVNALV